MTRRQQRGRRAPTPGGRSVPALYGALTAGLVVMVIVVASMVVPATPPAIAELGPSARDRIEEARDNQGIGSGEGAGDRCAPDVECLESEGTDPTAGPGSGSGIPPALQVAAGRRCFGDPPRQTEDPHSPPCVFEIFKGDNGGATAPGVTATEIRIAIPHLPGNSATQSSVEPLFAHFNLRYEFYGRRLSPVYVPINGDYFDPTANRAAADDLIAAKPFGVASWLHYATNAILYRRLSHAGVVSVVSRPPAFDSDVLTNGLAWLVDPPLDVRLNAGANLVCRALNNRPARHAGADSEGRPRRYAVVVVAEPSGRPNSGSLESGLRGCDADFGTFDIPLLADPGEYETLALQLKNERFTTVLIVGANYSTGLHQAATRVGYFPEWMDLGLYSGHWEYVWAGPTRQNTGGHGDHAFGFTPDVRVRPDSEDPAIWASREGGGTGSAAVRSVGPWYQGLLVLASGIQGAGPNLTPETFAQALWTMDFANPNPGAPPHWQQGIGFDSGDQVFHDDYAIWWWNENAPSQTSDSISGRGSFCYLDRGARFSAETFPANADSRLFNTGESCR